jgi:[protein-PII] uridylyltransferase
MNEAGVLGRFIPEFGGIVAQMQFNMYHSYTVDEHTLKAIAVIADIAQGKLGDDHPLSVATFPMIEDKEALFLAMLLHDTGKGKEEGQELGGAKAARSACTRMGLEPERVELVAWLVEHHLVMSDFAQKRDVSDPSTVAAFANIVQNPERLRLLLVLTVADIRAVGPGVWNGWKGQLMRELVGATESVFRGGRGADPSANFRRHQAEQAAEARAGLLAVDPQAADWASAMEDAYFTGWTPTEIQSHAALGKRAMATGGAAASARIRADRNAAEVTLAARDRRGLFADLASVFAAMGADIVGARVYTSRSGQALDVFYVQDAAGHPFGGDNAGALQRLTLALETAARGEHQAFEARRPWAMDRAAAFAITPIIAVDNEASADATVIEVSARDRPGLLEAVARTLAEARLSIASAHIDNYGERAVDAFYVYDEEGRKLTDARRINGLKKVMAETLADDEPAAPGRPRLQRARASAAR